MIDFLYYCYNAWPYLVIALAIVVLAVRGNWFRAQQMKHVPRKEYWDLSTTFNNSTEWVGQDYCLACKKTVPGIVKIRGVCPHCGVFVVSSKDLGVRSYRTIWDGEQWIHQYRYRDGKVYLRKTPL